MYFSLNEKRIMYVVTNTVNIIRCVSHHIAITRETDGERVCLEINLSTLVTLTSL